MAGRSEQLQGAGQIKHWQSQCLEALAQLGQTAKTQVTTRIVGGD
ncbi:hypothetical protein [Gloeobacter morelensis]|nr:hypothetical protein [Gloeobacter morelensis]